MRLLDEEILSRLAAMGIDVTALIWSCSPRTACPCSAPAQWQPPADVYEINDKVVIKLELAGVDVGAVTLTVTSQSAAATLVIIRGERRDQSTGPRSGVGHMEIEYGPFEKRIWLPWLLSPRGIRATYDRGFLHIALSKAPRPVERSVSIRMRV